MRPAALLLCSILAGCAAPQTAWHHPSKPTTSYAQDESECDLMATTSTAAVPNVFDAAFKRREILDKCMASRGYLKFRVQ